MIKFWTGLIRQISLKGGITYTELKAMDIFKFFVILNDYEVQVNKEIAAHKKLTQKSKKKR